MLGHLLDALRPDVLHLHSLFNLSFALPRLAAERGIPCVATLHDYTPVCPSGGKRVHRAEQHVCHEIETERCARCFAESAQARQMAAAGVIRPGLVGTAALAGARFARRHAPAALDRLARAASRGEARVDQAQIERRLASFFDDVVPHVECFVAPSSSLAAEFRRLGLPEAKLSVADNGVEPFEPAAVERPRAPLRIGFVGSLTWEKGVHRLIAAAARLPVGSFEMHLFGEAPESDYDASLRRLAAGLPIRFHGVFERDAIADVYRDIDLLAVPSIWLENSPLVIHEAHRAGVPVVGARIGGIAELIRHGETGLLFDPARPEEPGESLAALLAAPERVAAFARAFPVRKRSRRARWSGSSDTGESSLAASPRALRPQPATRRLGAVVVNYRTAPETLQAVGSLEASRAPFDPIVVVDNDSGDGSGELLERRLAGARLLRNTHNVGFSAGVNTGIRAALESGADRILLLNSDALLAADAVEKLSAALDGDATVGIAAPVILDATDPGRIASCGISFSARTGRMRMVEAGAHHQPGRAGSRVVDGVAGCAMLIAREVFERIGLFDEEYFFSFEDLDFCLRARRAGFASVCVLDAVAYHHGSRSIGPRSPQRLYFAARNHLLLARRAAPQVAVAAAARASWILALNLAFALRGEASPRAAGVLQVLRGVGHHLIGRYRSGAPSGDAPKAAPIEHRA